MARRERARAERRKRKQRSAARRAAEPAASANGDGQASPEPVSRSELKDREARAALVPLAEGERPRVVTIGALICAALSFLSVLGYALWDVLRDTARPPVASVAVFVILFAVMAWGMWQARYWAVMGFQTVLVFALVLTAIGLLGATTLLQVIGDLVLLAAAGTLFYFMVKAMARIQMPQRLPRD